MDHYRTLGIDRGANQDQVARAFRERVRCTHPDIDPSPAATAQLLAVIEAGEVLRSPERRQRYDNWLASLDRPAPTVRLYRHASLASQVLTVILGHLARRAAVANRAQQSGRVR